MRVKYIPAYHNNGDPLTYLDTGRRSTSYYEKQVDLRRPKAPGQSGVGGYLPADISEVVRVFQNRGVRSAFCFRSFSAGKDVVTLNFAVVRDS